jgi:hypothetical protein
LICLVFFDRADISALFLHSRRGCTSGDIGHIQRHGQRLESQAIGAREDEKRANFENSLRCADLILRLGESEIKHAWWVYAGEWAESSGWAKFRMRRCNCASETAHCRARPECGNLRDAVFFAGRIKVFVFGDPLLNILRRHPRIRRTSSIRDVACARPRLH